jgi:hypothetical protein
MSRMLKKLGFNSNFMNSNKKNETINYNEQL